MTTPSNDQPCYDSALNMAAKIRSQIITSRELVEMHIARIKKYNGQINAIIAYDFEDALHRADEADKALRDVLNSKNTVNEKEQDDELIQTKLGPFHGVPITLKESIFTPGFRTTCGDPKIWLPPGAECETAKILIEKGGAILLGKSNLCMNLIDWECNNPIYGKTCNPYDVTRSPGGSSGGAAAALAAGFTPLEIGTDLGGSIRVPAAMCGVVGHCGTRGLIPSPNPMYGWSCVDRFLAKSLNKLLWMSRAGPLARTVEDVIQMVELLGGDEAAGLPRRPANSSLSGCRIALWRYHDISPPGKEVSGAMDKVAKALDAAGAVLEELKPPIDPVQTYIIYLRFVGPVTRDHMSEKQKLNAKNGRAQDIYPSSMRSPFWESDMAGVLGVPEENQAAYEEAAKCWDDYLRRNYDAVICPVFPCEAWPMASEPDAKLGNIKTTTRPIVIDGEERCYGDALFWAHLSVLCGFPSTSFPVCLSEHGLPVGLQAFGCKGSDFVLLDIVSQLMKLRGSNNFVPPLDFGSAQ